MCSSTHHIIVPSDSDVGDAFSSTNTSGYIIASPDYFPALPGNTSPDFLEHLSKDLLASLTISPFHDDPYMKIMQAYNAISNESHIPSQAPIAPPIILPSSPQDFDQLETELQEARTQIAGFQRKQIGHDDEIVLARDTIRMAPKRTSTSAAPPMTQDVIKKLVADSVAAALEAQAATMENTNNTNRNTRQSGTPIARKCSYKDNCTEKCKVKFATGTLTEEALSWWNSFTQPIGIEEAYKITWSEFKKLLIKKYCPRTEIKKMRMNFSIMMVKEMIARLTLDRFRSWQSSCLPMWHNTEKKLMESSSLGDYPRSIEGMLPIF
ncbi:hypothetical protein Tco_0554821 [Tanacetum coccineum]